MTSSRLPNLVISGVVKGGTTSLFSYLSCHPNICSSSVKETCYFLFHRYGQQDRRYRNSPDPFAQYQQYFANCSDQKYLMEATPGYFEGGAILANEIKHTLGENVKIIIMLREPVDRLSSFFKFKKSMLELDKDMSLESYVQMCKSMPMEQKCREENDKYWGVDGGIYSNYMNDWFETFGDSIKVFFFDQLRENPKLLLIEICNWLDIDSNFYEDFSFEVENKTVGFKYQSLQKTALYINNQTEIFWRSHPKLKKKIRDFYYSLNGEKYSNDRHENTLTQLHSIYQPSNLKLANQLKSRGYVNLPGWLNVEP